MYIIISVLCVFWHNTLLKQLQNEEHFTCTIHCKKQSMLYEQVDALETEITEEISVIESSFALMKFLEVLMNA